MSLFLFLAAVVAAVSFSLWIYRRRELPVAGRGGLAAVRAAVLVLVLLLLFDPSLPALSSTAPGSRWVLVDGSASMGTGASGATPWDSAVARARPLVAEGWRPLRFGDAGAREPDSALAGTPGGDRSRLVPALEGAAEAGAREVVVLSDLRLEDPVAVRAALERLRIGARFVELGGEVANGGIAELTLPAAVETGAGISGEVAVFASAGAGDSALVEVREEERLVFSARVALPGPGRLTRVPLTLPAAAAIGEVRYRASIELDGDAFAQDDEAVRYVVVDPREGTVLAVSFAPDWELRQLLPVLARVTGLPTRGYLRTGDRFTAMGGGAEAAPALDAVALAARARQAELLVLHGLDAGAPEWARAAAANGRRVLVFPVDPAAAAAAGVAAGPRRAGEWYVEEEVPASPLAGELGGIGFAELPPLTGLLPRTGDEAGAAPLEARLRGVGGTEAPLVLVERPQGRAAIALGSGWWRWAARPGAAEEAYGRVWSATAGWLLAGDAAPTRPLRPVARVVPPGAPVEWRGAAPDGARLTVMRGDSVVTDTALAAPVDAVRTPALPPGSYRYAVVAGADSTSGRFDVHATSAELRHARMAAPDSLPPGPGAAAAAGAGTPLRTHPLPWLLLLGLLCGEWVVRRRLGLR